MAGVKELRDWRKKKKKEVVGLLRKGSVTERDVRRTSVKRVWNLSRRGVELTPTPPRRYDC